MEWEEERGVAHMIEHLAFRASRTCPQEFDLVKEVSSSGHLPCDVYVFRKTLTGAAGDGVFHQFVEYHHLEKYPRVKKIWLFMASHRYLQYRIIPKYVV